MYSDGWVERNGHVVLSGGDAGNLVIRALVLPAPDQRLEVLVNGQSVSSGPVADGLLELAIPVPESRGPRHVELRWNATTRISPGDPREAAALLKIVEVASLRAPTSLRFPGSLGVLGLDYSGIYRDGWSEKNAHVVLAGGQAGQLVIRAQIPKIPNQRLDVRLDGRTVAAESVSPGPLDLRIPVPASEASRRLELDWAAAASTSPDDPRSAAALLRFIGISAGRAPATVRIPVDLSDPEVDSFGIMDDGWAESSAGVVLAGGEAGELVIRAHVPECGEQHVDVSVDGHSITGENVMPGALDLRVPVPASDSSRRIELRWATTGPVGPADPRQAAALLEFLGIASGRTPAALRRIPTDLADPNLEYSGIYKDGWLEEDVRVVLAGGGAGNLVLRAQVLPGDGQHLDVIVDGHTVLARDVTPGMLELRIPVPAASSDRQIELHWASTAAVAPNDPRQAAALLEVLALAPMGPG